MDKEEKKILIVDDDPDIIEFLSYNLRKGGYEVIFAGSGLNALWEVEDDRLPDLILLDLMMPSPDGYEVCQFLKSSDDFRNVPLIIVSAKGTREDVQKGLGLGANAYITKPFTIDELFQSDARILDGFSYLPFKSRFDRPPIHRFAQKIYLLIRNIRKGGELTQEKPVIELIFEFALRQPDNVRQGDMAFRQQKIPVHIILVGKSLADGERLHRRDLRD